MRAAALLLAAVAALVTAAPASADAVADVLALREITDRWRYVNAAEAAAHEALAPQTPSGLGEQLVRTRVAPQLRAAVRVQPQLDRRLRAVFVTTTAGRLIRDFDRRALRRQAAVARRFLADLRTVGPLEAAERFSLRMLAERRRTSTELRALLARIPRAEREAIAAALSG